MRIQVDKQPEEKKIWTRTLGVVEPKELFGCAVAVTTHGFREKGFIPVVRLKIYYDK